MKEKFESLRAPQFTRVCDTMFKHNKSEGDKEGAIEREKESRRGEKSFYWKKNHARPF